MARHHTERYRSVMQYSVKHSVVWGSMHRTQSCLAGREALYIPSRYYTEFTIMHCDLLHNTCGKRGSILDYTVLYYTKLFYLREERLCAQV